MSRAFVARLESFAAQHEIPLVQFRKGQRKDDVAKEYLRKLQKEESVVFVGKAQEKTPVFRPRHEHVEVHAVDPLDRQLHKMAVSFTLAVADLPPEQAKRLRSLND